MTSSLFPHGELHAPYFLFLRCAGRHSDADLLARFGLSTYRPVKEAPRLGRHTVLADDGKWAMIADDWHYTLWHMPSTRPALAALAETCDVFACSVGDCDCSFDFVYYRDSRLVRKYVVASPGFTDQIVVENFGPPLPAEPAAFRKLDERRTLLGIAASLGIKTDYAEEDVRVYAPTTAEATAKR